MTRRVGAGLRYGLFPVAFLAGCLFLLGNGALAAEDRPGQAPSGQEAAQDQGAGATSDCKQLAELIRQQNSLISKETGQIKREIAAMREDASRPGIKEVFAGLGYIFGLAGVGIYAHNRKNRRG